jgi:TolB-like protein
LSRAASLLAGALLAASPLRAQCPDGAPPPCARSRATAPLSIAVLTFENRSRDSSDAYLADGLGDEIAARLGQVERLTVTSRVAVRRLRNADAMPVPELGRALRASYLVAGSIQRSGDQMRVAVELLRATTSAQTWSTVYDRRRGDLLAIQADIATQVAGAVAGRLLPREQAALATRPTQNPDAYDAYLRGTTQLTLIRGGQSAPQLQIAASALERAVALDSNFAPAWAALSDVYSEEYWWYVDRTDARIAAARIAAEHALRIAPRLPAGRVALGNVYYRGGRDYERALAEFREALRLDPGNAEALGATANIDRRQGRWEASLSRRLGVLALDPRDAAETQNVAMTLQYLRRYDEAEQYADRAIALAPEDVGSIALKIHIIIDRDGDITRVAPLVQELLALLPRGVSPWAQFLPSTILAARDTAFQRAIDDASLPAATDPGGYHSLKIWRARAAGRTAEATAHAESLLVVRDARLRADSGDAFLHDARAWALMLIGRAEEALRENETAVRIMPVSRDAFWGYDLVVDNAVMLAAVGRSDEALDRIEGLLRAPSGLSRGQLRLDPSFDPLRGNPRFERLLGNSPSR